ncbi:metallophosphoesterase [Solidesulfovibrio fructosivorans JJ]]|uniref:Metallophosphoesterase n=1 Tax=Solidesulfovibrio fructosivorans JJ] TaxID=596151 RepID=E1JSS0_SOLFR|nr:phosphodiesterase [Solidesulfovibrio fructosivorans]EFL52553.1 metallophosphoesterase [Solidesulfovibrio fructosivorans JJ]]
MLIAQLSDLHVAENGLAYGQAPSTQALANAVAYLNALVPAPDVVLVSGDIADHGLDGEYAQAASLLGRLKARFLPIPGNHDNRARLRAAFAPQSSLQAAHPDAPVRYVDDTLPLRLVGLDSTRPGQHGGGLTPQDLDWLEQVLAEGRPTLLFMHHPPFTVGIGNMDADGFTRAAPLQDLLGRFPNVARLCCGHMHRPVVRAFGGTLACIAPSTSLQLALDLTPDAPSRFMLEPGGLALHYLACPDRDPAGLVTHFGLIPGCGHSFPGPFPFYGVTR